MVAWRYKISLLVLKNISLVLRPHLWKIFQHSKRNFARISARPCNILYLPKTISYYPLPPHNRHYLLSPRWLLWRGLTVVHAVSLFSYWGDIIYFSIQFKVDRLQIILVAKKYISTCHNCSSVYRMPKMRADVLIRADVCKYWPGVGKIKISKNSKKIQWTTLGTILMKL